MVVTEIRNSDLPYRLHTTLPQKMKIGSEFSALRMQSLQNWCHLRIIDKIRGEWQSPLPASQLSNEFSGPGVTYLPSEEDEVEVVLLLQLGNLGEDALEQPVGVAGEQHLCLPLLILHTDYKPKDILTLDK